MINRLASGILKRQSILGRFRRFYSINPRVSLIRTIKFRPRTLKIVGTGFVFGSVGLKMINKSNNNDIVDNNNSNNNNNDNATTTTTNTNNSNTDKNLDIENSRKRLMASISVPDHYSIVWIWLYIKRFTFLYFNFLPMIIVAPLAYFSPKRWKEYWLEMIRKCFGNGGSTFIKLAQWISMREDIFPIEICEALAGLRMQAPIHSFEETCRVVEDSFGRKIDEIFETFYIEPVASGSIAQVHRAQICVELPNNGNNNNTIDNNNNDNENKETLLGYLFNKSKDSIFSNKSNEIKLIDVAVKVRHPNILQDMAIDINILYALSNIISSIPGFGGLKVPIYQPKFAQYLESQIDLCYEAQSLEIFNQNFQNSKYKNSNFLYESNIATITNNNNENNNNTTNATNPTNKETTNNHIWRYMKENNKSKSENKSSLKSSDVIFPLPIKGLISKGCLVETWEYGIPLCDLDLNKLTMNHRYKLAKHCYDVFMTMLLRDNFVHGDCHSGNILIKGENIDGPLVFLDAGLTASLSRNGSDKFGLLMANIARGNTDGAALMFTQWCMLDDSIESQERKNRFANGLSKTIDKHLEWRHGTPNKGIPYINVGSLLRDVLLLTQKEEIVLESQFSAVIASLGVIEGLIKHLYPKADFLSWGVPYLIKHKKIDALKYLMQYVT